MCWDKSDERLLWKFQTEIVGAIGYYPVTIVEKSQSASALIRVVGLSGATYVQHDSFTKVPSGETKKI